MNNKNVVAPVYSQIALDIAMRISRGEIQESTKLYGRSVLASQYGVSPETIRRAIKILEDVQIDCSRANALRIIWHHSCGSSC